MILRTDSLKDVCSKILSAVDGSELSMVTDTLELKSFSDGLHLRVTNKEYFVDVKLAVEGIGDFHAAVNANLFLKLISQITTETIELAIDSNILVVKGNGTYKLPLAFEGDKILELPTIVINNVTLETTIAGDSLVSILQHNSKELLKGNIAKPVQKMYYVDEKGCITFTTGACVNSFSVDKPFQILLNSKVVKLFKLFKSGDVAFSLGYDALSDDTIQTKVSFSNGEIVLTAILSCDDTLLKQVPVNAIRGRADNQYPHSVTVSKDSLIQTLNRLSLFNAGFGTKEIVKAYSKFEFKSDAVVVWDVRKENNETVMYNNSAYSLDGDGYTVSLDVNDLKLTLESCSEQYVTLNFGDRKAVVVVRGNIKTVIPEIITME